MVDRSIESSLGLASKEDGKLDDIFQDIQLNNDELDSVVLDAEVIKERKKGTHWMAIGKVLTARKFILVAL